ncbi:MAG: hypothetical protein MJZ89_04905 [Paludibacteraceae bacterium]|nr:hypothetical protein [Paludibacteraceae bacterium]
MKAKYYIVILLTILMSSCVFEPESPASGRTLPVVLSFAADVMGTPQQSRAIGDPGDGDLFELPQYVYLYVFGYNSTDKSGAPRMLQPTTGNPVRLSTNINDWSVNANGNIYTYNHTIDILVGDANTFKSGEAYVVASVEQIDGITPTGADDAAKLADLKAKTFAFPSACFTSTEMPGGTAVDEATASATRNRFLKNLYSSPINLYYEWKNNSYTVVNGEYKIVAPSAEFAQYYGTVLDASSKIPHVSMVLYHVAARLDVMWDVENDLDMNKRVTGLKVSGLKSSGCQLFLPTNDGASLTGDYTETFLPYDSDNASLYWQGREVRYVIQQGNTNIPLSGTIQLKRDTEKPISATILVDTPHRDIFTGWLRGYIKL